MGGMNSCCIPRYHNPNQENHVTTPKAKGPHRRNLSAAFNLAELACDADVSMEQMNINHATEEELMTLPGINRQTAVNIVDYRRQIGGFKKVEDLALVSGVGATKLNEIRVEICVKNKKSSQSSSRSSSRTDMQVLSVDKTSSRGHSRQSSGATVKVNINTANVFQLMKIKGITQLLAENIVTYRDKKKSFKTVDELVKVKGVTPGLVSALRPFLVLEDEAPALLAPPTFFLPVDPGVVVPRMASAPNGTVPVSSHVTPPTPSSDGGVSPDLASSTYELALETLPPPTPTCSQDDLLAMYGPLLKRSFRRAKPPTLRSRRTGTQSRSAETRAAPPETIRIGSWNLQGLSSEKAENPGVKEVVCLTVLENGLSIVAMQEVRDPEALQKLCDELNRPTIPNVKRWTGPRGRWRCVCSALSASLPLGHECLGFMYDADVVSLEEYFLLHTLPGRDVQLTTKPFFSQFKINDALWTLCTLHIGCYDGEEFGATTMQMLQALYQRNIDSKYLIVMGDVSTASVYGELARNLNCPVTTEGCSAPDNGDVFIDSILLNAHTASMATGDTDVVEDGLTSPWIPRGWQWGGAVSEHFPLWVEVYASADAAADAAVNAADSGEEDAVFSSALDMAHWAKPLAAAGTS